MHIHGGAMTARTVDLHSHLLAAIDGRVAAHGQLDRKPLELDLKLPMPPRLRIYMYTLVEGGAQRPNEFKAVLRVPGQVVGEYASFDHSGGRLAVLAAYREDLDVFVLWDASLHPRFKHGGNVQVRDTIVFDAAAIGWAEQRRGLTSGITEVVLACQSHNLDRGIIERVAWTGGVVRW